MPRSWNLLRNSAIDFHVCSYSATYLLGRFIFGGPAIAYWLTGKSLSAVKWEPMKPARNPRVSLATETGIFLWMTSPLISAGPLFSLPCSARVHHCLRFLVRVVDWCESVGKADLLSDHFNSYSSPWRQLICRSPAFRRAWSYHLCLQVKLGQASLVRLGPLWRHWPIGYFPPFLKEMLMLWLPVIV